MGGKGSGRHEKLMSKILDEIAAEISEIDELIIDSEINRRMGNLVARISYHITKLERVGK